MTPPDLDFFGISPALTMLPAGMDTLEARRMLIAIALQESDLEHRKQIFGPARGFWQFEPAGVQGVLEHHATRDLARGMCSILEVVDTVEEVHAAITFNDVLAAGFARLLLWQLPEPMAESLTEGWEQYIRAWRPGRPRANKWLANWKRAGEE